MPPPLPCVKKTDRQACGVAPSGLPGAMTGCHAVQHCLLWLPAGYSPSTALRSYLLDILFFMIAWNSHPSICRCPPHAARLGLPGGGGVMAAESALPDTWPGHAPCRCPGPSGRLCADGTRKAQAVTARARIPGHFCFIHKRHVFRPLSAYNGVTMIRPKKERDRWLP